MKCIVEIAYFWRLDGIEMFYESIDGADDITSTALHWRRR
jgi:hypothetical protein